MRRSGPPKRKRQRAVRIGNAVEIAMANKVLFRDAARDQRCCQMCGSTTRDWQAHHVVYEQHLVKEGLPQYSTPNALRLCRDCHELHHKRRQVIPVSRLLDRNIEYAFDALGPKAYDYFSRYYDATHILPDGTREPRLDPRVEAAMRRAEAA